MHVDLVFPTFGTSIPIDHSYPLYAALSGIIPQFHKENSRLRLAPISGKATADGKLQVGPQSCLRVRLPDDQIKMVLPLAGKRLDLGEFFVRLGVPCIRTLIPATAIVARMVTFKNAHTPEEFLATARAKLEEAGISGEPQLPIHLEGERTGEPKRRVLRIKGATITGYSLVVSELSAADSIRLQEAGLGGRTRMGCGFFIPANEKNNDLGSKTIVGEKQNAR